MINLTKFLKQLNIWRKTGYEDAREIILMGINYDDILSSLIDMGVEELEVDKEQMIFLTRMFCNSYSNTELGAKALLEGKIDTLLGIKLFLI